MPSKKVRKRAAQVRGHAVVVEISDDDEKKAEHEDLPELEQDPSPEEELDPPFEEEYDPPPEEEEPGQEENEEPGQEGDESPIKPNADWDPMPESDAEECHALLDAIMARKPTPKRINTKLNTFSRNHLTSLSKERLIGMYLELCNKYQKVHQYEDDLRVQDKNILVEQYVTQLESMKSKLEGSETKLAEALAKLAVTEAENADLKAKLSAKTGRR